ncbi:MAG: hypothetical protein IJI36_13625 [Kiritimatiellae bacterium]|nr:hypothetical protein [Kiritimatiellia bacterium]
MKMIARMFCAAALVLGAFSLVGCDQKKDEAAKPAAAEAKDAVKDAKDAAKDAAKDVKDAAKGAADAVKK